MWSGECPFIPYAKLRSLSPQKLSSEWQRSEILNAAHTSVWILVHCHARLSSGDGLKWSSLIMTLGTERIARSHAEFLINVLSHHSKLDECQLNKRKYKYRARESNGKWEAIHSCLNTFKPTLSFRYFYQWIFRFSRLRILCTVCMKWTQWRSLVVCFSLKKLFSDFDEALYSVVHQNFWDNLILSHTGSV